jgi:hypothetical protein
MVAGEGIAFVDPLVSAATARMPHGMRLTAGYLQTLRLSRYLSDGNAGPDRHPF